MRISGKYNPLQWDEVTIGEVLNGTKFTKASIKSQFMGDIEGTASIEYLMFYTSFDEADMHAAEATYLGFMRIEGFLQGKEGSFVLKDTGTFSKGVAESSLEIIAESGTKQLKDISGAGSAKADQKGCVWQLDILI